MMAAPISFRTPRIDEADVAELARRLEALRQCALDEIREAEADAVVPASVEVHDRAEEAEGERVDEVRMAETAIDEALVTLENGGYISLPADYTRPDCRLGRARHIG